MHITTLHQVSLFSVNENHKWRGSKMINKELGDFVYQLVDLSKTPAAKLMILNVSLKPAPLSPKVMAWKFFKYTINHSSHKMINYLHYNYICHMQSIS